MSNCIEVGLRGKIPIVVIMELTNTVLDHAAMLSCTSDCLKSHDNVE